MTTRRLLATAALTVLAAATLPSAPSDASALGAADSPVSLRTGAASGQLVRTTGPVSVSRQGQGPTGQDLARPHVDDYPKGVDPHASTDTRSLYRRAGLPQPKAEAAGASDGSPAELDAAGTATVPPGTPNTPGLTQHVLPSCTGTGTDGNRVQVLYVREAGTTSRFAKVLPLLRDEVANIDDVFALSAQRTGGGLRVRWVQNPDCTVDIREVSLPAGSLGSSFATTKKALAAAGYDKANRKYLAFADAKQMCGIASYYDDDEPTGFDPGTRLGNANDGYAATYARVDSGCWVASSNSPAAHELTHMLGSVQASAPHASDYGHCTDDNDLMCYADGTKNADGTAMVPAKICTDSLSEHLLDCRNDDYFSTDPAAGSYLATHWDTANSSFLDPAPPVGEGPSVAFRGLSVSYGADHASLTARLTDAATGLPLAGHPVSVQALWSGATAWATLPDTLQTDGQGAVVLPLAAQASGSVRFVFAGDSRLDPTTSTEASVKAVSSLTGTVRAGRPDVLRGRLRYGDGAVLGGRVVLQRRWAGSRSWVSVAAYSTDTSGNVVSKQRPRRRTYYRWVFGGTATVTGDRSAQLYVRR